MSIEICMSVQGVEIKRSNAADEKIEKG
jgi:hypothetical protein